MRARRALLLAPFVCSGCFSLLTDSDGIAGGAKDGGYVDPGPKAEYEKRYTEVLGRWIVPSTLPTGLTAISGGVTFPSSGKLIALFGDDAKTYDDAVGFAPIALPATGVPALSWLTNASGLIPLRVPSIDLGRGNVPVEGLVEGDKTYVFFATGFDAATNRYGGAALAHTSSDLSALSLDFASTTNKFVHVSVVRDGATNYIYGTGADFRRSPIYLAKTTSLADRAKWTYFTPAGFAADNEASARPIVDHGCAGEVSVRRHPSAGLYVMAYACSVPRGVLVRLARTPEGPWSSAINVMDTTALDGGYGRTTHATFAVAGHDDGLSDARDRAEPIVDVMGMESAAHLVPEWFDANKTPENTFALVYTMSTSNPYTVWLMRTVLGRPGTTATPPVKGSGLPKATIVNGDFKSGLTGWTKTGEVRVYTSNGKARVTTSGIVPPGDDATGTLSQELTVDATTSQLSFLIHGGDATIKLLRGTEVVRQSWGRRTNDDSKVVWNLEDLRGETVKILIEDTIGGGWGFVGATEFTLN